MAYVPDPDDATNPVDGTPAETAQAEFRALKAKVNNISSQIVTLNPSDAGVSLVLGGGNLIVTKTASGNSFYQGTRATLGKAGGEWYWETTIGVRNGIIGIGISILSNTIGPVSVPQGYVYTSDGHKWNAGTTSAYGATFTSGDVIGVAVDLNAGNIHFYKNGIDQGLAFSGLEGVPTTYYPIFWFNTDGDAVQVNFGASIFSEATPSGFSPYAIVAPMLTGDVNILHNSDFDVDQRWNFANTGNLGSGVSYLSDRWAYSSNQANLFSARANSTGVTPPAGRINYQYLSCTTAFTTPAAGDYALFIQRVEGDNMTHLAYGTNGAKSTTLLFWVYGTITGTFAGALKNGDGSRSYVFTYTISQANTWTAVAINIPGDTGGTYNNSNGAGLELDFTLVAGTTWQTVTPNKWLAGNFYTVIGAINLASATGQFLYFAGIELRLGTWTAGAEATRRDYTTKLAQCQRYFWKIPQTYQFQGNASGAAWSLFCNIALPVPMRIAPTINFNYSGTTNTSSFATYSGTAMIGAQLVASGAGSIYTSIVAGSSVSADL